MLCRAACYWTCVDSARQDGGASRSNDRRVRNLFPFPYIVFVLPLARARGIVYFHGPGWAVILYRTILISHTILAIIIVPMVLITLTRGLRGQFDRHRAIARWTYPIWLYVSVTGVVVYLMLFQIFG